MTRTKNIKRVYVFMILAVICSISTSCSGKKPDYLLKFGRDNGFVAAYRAYIKIDGEQANKINEWRYDNYIHGKEEYDFVRYDTHSFDAVAKSADPNEWEYVQNKYDKDEYDVELVKNMLAQMGVNFTGDVYIVIYSFDNISVISAENMPVLR